MSEAGEGEIRRLDQSTIERIAAGEVVERPASVVKELVENSLDADASRVRVTVERGGKDGIRVADDGTGMTRENVERAVEKHTTSKIGDISDLEAGVSSLGFRGEALAAIGAVARVTIRTKARGESRGTELRMAGGEVETVEPAGCPEGTTVEVSDLFYNVPARRKYLKRDATEFAHVNRVATGYALSKPDLALVLEHDDREVFSTTGQGSLEATILSVYGREVAEAMVPVDGDGADLPDGPLDGVTGVVSHPETNRASPEHCSTFINGRYVTARAVRDAVVEAYGGQLAPDRYPFAVVFLSISPESVDVNVHPRKLEVRFADESGATEQVKSAVESALLDAGLVRSGAPRGRSAPEQTEIDPGDDGATNSAEPSSTPRDTNVDAPRAEPSTTDPEPVETTEIEPSSAATGRDPESEETPTEATSADLSTEPSTDPSMESSADPAAPSSQRDQGNDGSSTPSNRTGEAERSPVGADRKFSGGETQTTLDGDRVADDADFDRLPPLRVLGQLHDTYVVCESPDGLLLVDQHAADERVNYERLRERFAGDTGIQRLSSPIEIELTPAESELFAEFENALAGLGFRADLDDGRVEVTAVPAVLAGAADPELLRDALSALVRGKDEDVVEASADALLADLACYPSVTGNTSLTEGSVMELLASLDACENPYACPHGRPVVVEIGETALADRFERDYPGHAGRRVEE
ncbi:DNA mismatch repair endonuclease MutL [Halococcus hamelinensis]|uniref:DNA mismatch repair protein MutL n=1 Tax=Halococcus hamelinensis 100A6 TaxID=1132509 RepID=M0M2K8_9EURY|nr:DNA mismatch repair endonuclease MutL [Halococcus hamelinensis]EMA39936.1 DNA mismatch repair protein MutL [Halococcus hamelinensis 100A6]